MTTENEIAQKHPVIFHGWLIVVTGIVVYALGYGSRYSFSVIFPSLLKEFGWPRDVTAAMLSVHMLVYGIVAPVAGHLVDRVGPRIPMAAGTCMLALGLGLSALAGKPWHFYLTFGILTGAGLCLAGAVPFTSVLRNWFERRRGLAFSLLFFGTGGAFVFYPGVAFLIERIDWRRTFVVEAVIVAGVILPMIILIVRYHPREKGLFADGIPQPRESAEAGRTEKSLVRDHSWAAISWTLGKAAKTGRFWLLCLSTFSVWGIMQHIMVTHHVAFVIDVGYSKVYASSVLSLFGIMFALGSLVGFLSDRIGREATITLGTILGISGIVVLMAMKDTSDPWMLYYYSISFGLGLGITAPTIPAALTDIFQGPKVGAIIGAVWFSFAMGGTIGPWLGGWVFELTGNYISAFIVAIVLFAVACAAIWLASPRKVRRVPGRLVL